MVKLIGIIWFLSHYLGALAMANQISPLIRCIAKEEEQIHLNKVQGPIVKLNREMLSLFSTVDQLSLKKNFFDQVCHPRLKFSPSLNLVRVILTHGKQAFYSTTQDLFHQGFHNSFLADLVPRTGKLLIRYLSQIQGLTPQAHCLKKSIKSLPKIYQKYKVLEEHIKTDQLMEASDIAQIFAQLKRLDK